MDIREKFEKTIVVNQYDCDLNGRMKAGAILRQVQQVSTDHCTCMGITDELYRENHCGFLIAKVSVEIYGEIKVGDKLKLVTRPAKAQRAVYARNTGISSQEGDHLASVDARWILVDTENRRILRRCPEGLPLNFGAESVECHNISIPKVNDAQAVGTVAASYSRTDVNHHMNNTEYADIICDCLPMELMMNKAIRKLVIHYHKEIRLGESVEIFRKELPEGWYFCGMLPEKNSFEAWVEFRE